jgi:hypothetical protein
MMWRGKVYVDKVLPFGLRTAPKVFTALADALEWVLQSREVGWCIHLIDDFLTMGKANTDECSRNLGTIKSSCSELGIPLKAEKVEGPSAEIVFLGIVLDTVRMELRLPQEKVEDLKQLLAKWAKRKTCRKRQLLSLIGKLAHACKIVRVGRIFLRRMIDYSMKAKCLDHWIHLGTEIHADIGWWQAFLEAWNHRAMMHLPGWGVAAEITFASDASGHWGCGAAWGDQWLQWQWEGEWVERQIAIKEMVPVVVACAIWGKAWEYRTVRVQCDNMAVVQVLNSLTSRDPTLMHLLRCLHYYLALFNIHLRAEHIPGVLNTVADCISRNMLQVFRQLVPRANPEPMPIPASLKEMMSTHHQNWLLPAWRALLKC